MPGGVCIAPSQFWAEPHNIGSLLGVRNQTSSINYHGDMQFGRRFLSLLLLASATCALSLTAPAQSSSSASKRSNKSSPTEPHPLDPGSVKDGLYRNSALAFSCKIPVGWVLRTDQMVAQEEDGAVSPEDKQDKGSSGRVLLAAFSRPPEAAGEDVNSSILIAAEAAASYPALNEAAQYFGPVTEVATAQGFHAIEEPYEFPVGVKTLARGDFQKNVGTRVMRQSTLVMLAHGYIVSFTFIGGTEDEVTELIQGLSFAGTGKTMPPPK
jgi:hypothetical protein